MSYREKAPRRARVAAHGTTHFGARHRPRSGARPSTTAATVTFPHHGLGLRLGNEAATPSSSAENGTGLILSSRSCAVGIRAIRPKNVVTLSARAGVTPALGGGRANVALDFEGLTCGTGRWCCDGLPAGCCDTTPRAQDAMQDVFVSLLRHEARASDESALSALLPAHGDQRLPQQSCTRSARHPRIHDGRTTGPHLSGVHRGPAASERRGVAAESTTQRLAANVVNARSSWAFLAPLCLALFLAVAPFVLALFFVCRSCLSSMRSRCSARARRPSHPGARRGGLLRAP